MSGWQAVPSERAPSKGFAAVWGSAKASEWMSKGVSVGALTADTWHGWRCVASLFFTFMGHIVGLRRSNGQSWCCNINTHICIQANKGAPMYKLPHLYTKTCSHLPNLSHTQTNTFSLCAMTQRGAAGVKVLVAVVSCHHLEEYMSSLPPQPTA